jgi:hypothetical protein
MNELQNDSVTSVKKESGRSSFSLIAGFIVVLILISVLVYRAGIDPKQIKQDVADFARNISEIYAKKGLDVKVEYSEIEVKGGLFEKAILLKNPSITVKGGGNDYKLSTLTAKIIPLDSYFDELSIELASPITVKKDDMAVNYVPQSPLKIDIIKNESTEHEYLMGLPIAAEILSDKNGVVKKYTLKNSDSSFVSGAFSHNLIDNYSVSVVIEDLQIAGEDSTMAATSASISSISADDNAEFEMNVTQFASSKLPKALGAIDIDLVHKKQAGEVDGEKSFDLEALSVAGEGFDMNVKGRVVTRENEIMPIANLNVIVNGASKVFAAISEEETILPKNKNIVIQAIKLIDPEWNEFSLSPLQFEIRREENSPFVIGKVKADELIAMLVQQYFQMNDAAATQPEIAPAPAAVDPQQSEPQSAEPEAAEPEAVIEDVKPDVEKPTEPVSDVPEAEKLESEKTDIEAASPESVPDLTTEDKKSDESAKQ